MCENRSDSTTRKSVFRKKMNIIEKSIHSYYLSLIFYDKIITLRTRNSPSQRVLAKTSHAKPPNGYDPTAR